MAHQLVVDQSRIANGSSCMEHYPSDEHMAILKSSGYVAFETFDRAGRFLKTMDDWSTDPDNYQVFFMSLSHPGKRICHFDLAKKRDRLLVKKLLESQCIVKVTRKVAFASLLFFREHAIEVRSVIDLTATHYLVNQVGINSGNLVDPCILDDIGPNVQANMARLPEVWFRLYGALFRNLITLKNQSLDLFRTFHLE